MWSVNPDCQMTLGDQVFAEKHPMPFDDCNGLATEVHFTLLVRLDQSLEVDLVLFPECVVREV